MPSRGLIALIFLTALAQARADQGQPLSEAELTEFLGFEKSRTTLMTWTVFPGPDFVVYYGKANPPLSGGVGIYLGDWPSFEPDPSSIIVPGRLGIFPVKWRRRNLPEGGITQEAVIPIGEDYSKAHVWFEAKQQDDLDKLLGEVAQLPTFSFKHQSPFHEEIANERRSRRSQAAACLLIPSLFACSTWLLDRQVRRRKGSNLRRGLALAGLSFGWFLLFVGLTWLASPSLMRTVGLGFVVGLASAATGLIAGLLIVGVSWFLRRRQA